MHRERMVPATNRKRFRPLLSCICQSAIYDVPFKGLQVGVNLQANTPSASSFSISKLGFSSKMLNFFLFDLPNIYVLCCHEVLNFRILVKDFSLLYIKKDAKRGRSQKSEVPRDGLYSSIKKSQGTYST